MSNETNSSNRPYLAILGAGPVGLDAALAAAERGYGFRLYEAAEAPAGGVRSWGHVRLFSPWSLDASPRMRQALEAVGTPAPDGDECPTGHELVDRLLDPVAALPQVAPHLSTGVRVKAVGRQGLVKSDEISTPVREARPFRLLVEEGGRERIDLADAVIDATGSLTLPNSLGDGGLPAPGEAAHDDEIEHRIPDLAAEADRWAGRTILLVGAGHSAQTAARDLAGMAEAKGDGTKIHWVLRGTGPFAHEGSSSPDDGAEDDPLPARSALHRRADQLAAGASQALTAHRGVVVERLEAGDGGRVKVHLRSTATNGDGAGKESILEVDRILALTGATADPDLHRQLQIHECYASGAPMKLAAALLGASGGGGDCLALGGFGPETLVNPEPRYFIVGAKSYGRNSAFLMRTGWEQVDDVFGLLEASFGKAEGA